MKIGEGRKSISEMSDDELRAFIHKQREARREAKYNRQKNVRMDSTGNKQKRQKKDPLEKLSRKELMELKKLLGE